jgi:phosphoribosylformimino-5-aminoimidazole carboxamide ribotide isomerase
MRIVPAVDIRAGRCVNLVQGDYGRETVFSAAPVRQACQWHAAGAALIHIVDLDGALRGELCVASELRALAEAGVPFEVGGGIRNLDTIHAVFETGADRVILGTAAYRTPELMAEAACLYPDRLVAGVDARDGLVALSGWKEITETPAVDFARQMEEAGAARIIYTDILSDGMMKGPNLEATRAVAQATGIPVTASGGMATLENIRAVQTLEPDGVDEVIIGRALYLNAFTLEEALAAAGA